MSDFTDRWEVCIGFDVPPWIVGITHKTVRARIIWAWSRHCSPEFRRYLVSRYGPKPLPVLRRGTRAEDFFYPGRP
jgi:hypothetical protein